MRKKSALKHCSCRARQVALVALSVIFLTLSARVLWSVAGSARIQRRERRLLAKLQDDQAELQHFLAYNDAPQATQVESTSSVQQSSRGIVICAGGETLLANVYVSVKVLRGVLNCTLPIEIYHNGPKEVSSQTKAVFSEFADVRFQDLTKLPLPVHHSKPAPMVGYVQKIFSLYSTGFEQVLLLDADSQPLKDPATLFDLASFQEHGNLFWSDFWSEGFAESPEEVVYNWLGLEPPWKLSPNWRCAESGQVLFDRQRHADVLEWLWFLNSHAELLYKHMLGDKDTFEMAFLLAGKQHLYNRVPHGPGLPLSQMQDPIYHANLWQRTFGKDERARYLRLGMLQFDEQAEPAFLHRTERTKFRNKRKDGYSLDVMQPAFIAPPLDTALTSEVRDLVWRMHSIPASLADTNGICSKLQPSAQAVVDRASGKAGQLAAASGHRLTSIAPGSCLSGRNSTAPMIPIFPVALFGRDFTAAVNAGFEAYTGLHSALI